MTYMVTAQHINDNRNLNASNTTALHCQESFRMRKDSVALPRLPHISTNSQVQHGDQAFAVPRDFVVIEVMKHEP